MNSGNVYFISDAHLGSWAFDDALERERHLVRFLDSIKDKASAIYMMGDMFDFWYEFKYVVPKGYTRFLGKLSELTDSGIEVHFFTGNHDMWMFGYLEKECGVILHGEPECCSIMGHRFYLAHGDGLGDPGLFFRITRPVFRNRFCQFLFSLLPTRWSMYPDADEPGEQLYQQLCKSLPVIRHSLPYGCKDFSNLYLKKLCY